MKRICRIPLEARLDVFEGRANVETNALVNRHLAENCTACKTDMAWLTAYMPSVQLALKYSEQTASEWALARARNIMQPKQVDSAGRLVTAARLLFDSRNRNTTFAPARDGGDGSVHVVYRTETADVDMWQEQTRSGSWYLTGQALSLGGADLEAPTVATLVCSEAVPQLGSIENAEFSFESVTAGRYSLSLLWDDLEIQVDDLAVGCAEAP